MPSPQGISLCSTILKTTQDLTTGKTKITPSGFLGGMFNGDFFKPQSIVSKDDIAALEAYNLQIDKGADFNVAFDNTMKNASQTAQNLAKSAKGAAVDIDAIPKASKAAAAGMKALSVAGNMLLSIGITMAISAIVKGFQALANAQENAIAKADEFISKFNEQRTSLTDNKNAIDSMSADYEKLANGVDSLGRNVSLSSDEYDRYNEIANQIANMFPTMVQGYTSEGNAIIANKGKVEELTKAYEDQKKAAQDAIIVGSADVFKGFKAKVDHDASYSWEESGLIQMRNIGQDLLQQLDSGELDYSDFRDENSLVFNDFLKYAGIKLGIHWSDSGYEKKLEENRTKIVSAIDSLINDINAETVKIKPIMQAYLEQSFQFQGLDEDAQDVVKQIVGQFDSEFYAQFDNETEMAAWITENITNKFKGKNGEAMALEFQTMLGIQTQFNKGEVTVSEYQEKLSAFLKTIEPWPDETEKYIKLLFGISTDSDGKTSSDVDTMVANVKEKFNGKFEDEIGQLTLDELEILTNLDISPDGIESWSEVEALIAEAKKTADKLTFSITTFNEEMDKLQEGYNAVQSAIDEYNENGYLSIDTTQKLLELDDDFLATLVDENDQVNLNTLSFEDLARAKLENLKASATAALTDWIGKLQEEGTTADELAAKYIKVATAKDLANGEVATGYTDRDGNWVDITDTPTYKAYLARVKVIEDAIAGIGQGGLGGTKKTGSTKNEALDNYLKDAENRYKIHQDEATYVQELQYAYNNLTKSEKERLDIVSKINEANRDEATNKIKDIEHQIDLAKELYGEDFDATDYYDQIQTVAHEEADRYREFARKELGYYDEGVTDEQKAQIDADIENTDEIQSLQKAWWDAQNNKLDFSSNQHKNNIRNIEHARDMALANDENTDVVPYYKQLQTEYHKEAERLRAIDPEKYKEEIQNLQIEWWKAEEAIVEYRKDAMEKSISDIDDYIDARNTYNDWEAYGDSEVKAIQRQTKIIEDAYKQRLISYEEYVDRMEEQTQRIYSLGQDQVDKHLSNIDKYIDARNHYNDWDDFNDSEIEAIKRQCAVLDEAYRLNLISLEEYTEKSAEYTKKLYSVAKENIIETISEIVEDYEEMKQLESSKLNSQKTLLQSYYDVTNAIAEAQHEINKELKASQSMYEYLNEDTRELLFNQEDYNALSEELLDIQAAAEELQKQYQNDILNANAETIAEITEQYQMQYQTLMKQYEISKAELEVAKKRQKLDNVLAERNTRMFINGQWQWVANTQDVINAQNELAEAEIERQKQEASLEQTESINNLTTQINVLETDLNKVRKYWTDMQKLLNGESDEVAKALREISNVSSPELKRIVEATGGNISSFSTSLSNSTTTLSTIINSDLGNMSVGISTIITDLQNYSLAIQELLAKLGGSTGGRVLQVGADGNAPAGATIGDTIVTAGGNYKIVSANTPGATYNPASGHWSVKVGSSSGGSSSSSGKVVKVGSDGNAPSGTKVGDVVKTAGGDYLVVPPNTQGANYNPTSGLWSMKVEEKDANGTRYTSGGTTLMGEEGFEAFISNTGRLIPISQPTIGNIGAGGIVFNREQMANLRTLWDWSNLGKMSSYVSSSNANNQNTVIDNSIHINGLTVGEQGNEDWINGLRRYVATHK